ncbi:hypothetical protein OVA26_16810 [Microbacterium sp. SL62]|uniref:hypothetical protein n=1 Tax=Microbacterium sp. SL62 TaxID=2995139 RepID=UPI0022754DAF|nr:hypothetical protein [Microbacterium sp. SL62]MCY1718600.1 hypothetical protein [Microbacterium sp. SL62]
MSPDDFENELYRRALVHGGTHGYPWVSRLVTNVISDARELFEGNQANGVRP